MEQEKLLEEIIRLKKENERLKELLIQNNISFDEKKEEIQFSSAEKLKIYKSYFKGRLDVYTEKYIKKDGKKGYAKACKNRFTNLCNYKKYKQCKGCPNEVFKELNDDAYMQHLMGKKSNGIYPIIDKSYCYFLAIDFDDEQFKDAVLAYKNECKNLNIDSLIEISQSGCGAHVWIFFKEKTTAKKARMLGDYILSQAMLNNKNISFKSYDRFFPSQEFVDENGFGNCIALPLQGECVKEKKTSMFVDDNFVPYSNQIFALQETKKVSELELEIIFKQLDLIDASVEIFAKNIKKINLLRFDFKDEVEIIYKNDIFVSKKELSNKAIGYIKRLAVIYNPEYYEKQAKRMSTYNTPRFIELYKEDTNYISLPRGCYDDLLYILNYVGAPYELKDRRTKLKSIDVEFNATLRDNQQKAVDELLKYDNGLLVADTGSGKTIMGMSIIKTISKPTLILVEKVKLLEQWKERIKDFMNFNAGVYYGAKKKLTGIIDIASIKSLKEEDDIYDKYDTIIGDEIHHIASVTYESVIRRFNARHIYGFTATPNRSDHLEKIIFKCVSPIRAVLEKNNASFTKKLKPKFTKFKNKDEYDLLSYTDLCSELYSDENRNKQIANDVIEEYKNKRNILVLVERNDHIEKLYNLFKEHCENVFKINGSAKTKDKKIFSNNIKDAKNGFIIVSTGKYLGEGFDLPSLDTLFLTMPFKWKGLLSQYIGRIQREFEGKNQVTVYDYVDIKIGKFAHQFQLRLKEYKKEGFIIENENNKADLIFSSYNYKNKLIEDIENAKSVKFIFNYFNESILSNLFSLNDSIEIITDCKINEKYKAINKHCDLNVVIINEQILWYGSINPFTYPSKDGSILRIDDLEYVKEITSSETK